MKSLFLNDRVLFHLTLIETLFYSLNALSVVSLFAVGHIIYKFCRPLLPARVNCWFCNRNFLISYYNRNCFDCRFCGQYNGFTPDGDYNIDLLKREPKTTFCSTVKKKSVAAQENGLCKSCNVNQQLKVQQLANFIPLIESNYDSEIDHFKQKLEKAYRLCDECNLVLTQTLQTQHYNILTKRLNEHCPTTGKADMKAGVTQRQWGRLAVSATLHLLSLLCLGLLSFISGFSLLEYFRVTHSLNFLHCEVCLSALEYSRILSALGICSFAGSHIMNQRNNKRGQVILVSWGALQAITWEFTPIMFLPPLLIIIVIGYLLPDIPTSKVLEIRPINDGLAGSSHSKSLDQVVNASLKEVNSTPKKKKTISSQDKKETEKEVSNNSEDICTPPRRVETRSQTVEKAVKPRNEITKPPNEVTLDTPGSIKSKETNGGKRERLMSPPPEIYKRLNSLRLGSPEPSSESHRKPSNYLFEKINFKKSKKNCIIKPSKFGQGMSHKKCDSSAQTTNFSSTKTFGDRQISTISTTVSPKRITSTPSNEECIPEIDVTAISPWSQKNGKYGFPLSCSVEYDYPCNASLGYCPPMDYSTIYTYTRPAPYPFPFQPRFSPPYANQATFDSRMSPNTPDMFSNSNSSFKALSFQSQPWKWAKRLLYIASACLNLMTLIFLIVSFWKG